jgi:hypothetical protein
MFSRHKGTLTDKGLDNNILTVTPTASHPESTCLEVMDIMQSEMLAHDIICKFEVKPGYRALGVRWAELDPSRVQQVVSRIMMIPLDLSSLAVS